MLPEPLFRDRKRESYNNFRPPTSRNRPIGSYYEGNGHGCTLPRPSNGRYNGGRGSFRRSPYYNGERRSVDVQIIPTSLPPPLKDLHNKNSGSDDQILHVDRDRDRDRSLGCKSLKVEVSVPDLGKDMLVISAAAGLEDDMPRKRLRLAWGQGLAKYEKEKVEGSMNSETSLKVSGSMSPATPCSAAVCLTPGTEDRPFSKAMDVDKDVSHHSETSTLGSSYCLEGLHIKLNQLPLSVLTSLLDDLLQPEDACTGDSTFARYAATKLVLFKADISKELEKTECEIDLLENELKSLNNDGGYNPSQFSFSLQDECFSIPCPESVDALAKVSSDLIPVISFAMAVKQPDLPVCSSGKHEFEVKHANNDIPRIVLSSNGESTSSGNLEQLSLDLGEMAVTANDSGESNHSGGDSSSGSNANVDMSSQGNEDNNLIDLIITSNRDAARRASQALDRALPSVSQGIDIWGSDRILSCRKNDMHIREKLALRGHQIKFKERILSLKFRALNHLWKEDLKLLSVRKQQTKSQKHFDLCSRSSHSSLQKHRSSIQSRCILPAGNLSLVPTKDIVDFTSKLLSESQIKLYRNNLKMPALVLDEERGTRFITKNNLTEDPLSIEKERSMINPWTLEEKEVFMKKLATLGKDFAKISSFLDHKTTADCIELYYKSHKSESFTDVKKQLNLRKQSCCVPNNAYMVTSGRKWNRDSNAASLDMLGAVSVAVAHYNDHRRNQPKYSARSIVPSYHSAKVSHGSYGTLERADNTGISWVEMEIAGTDVAGEAVSSSVTSSICPLEKMNIVRMSRPLTPEVTQTIEEEATCSDEGCGGLESVDWTDGEKSLFIRALGMYGKDFARISHCVGIKSREQCKTFFSKARKCLGLDQIYPAAGNVGTLVSDANVGRSDTDAAEIDSAVCSTQSCSRMDVDFTQ